MPRSPAPVLIHRDPAPSDAPPSWPRRALLRAEAAGEAVSRVALPALHGVVDWLYPPQCTWCRAEVMDPYALCPDCWKQAFFICHPLCDRCGAPLSGRGDAPFCDHCLGRKLAFGRSRSALVYEGTGRDMVLAIKHGDRLDMTRPAATWMIRAGLDLLRSTDLIAPTPLHWRRLMARRCNQSAELARRIAGRTGTPYCGDLLRRVRATPPQGGLSRDARAANQAGAFAVPPSRRARLAGKRVLLIDDVYASGATLSACAEALLEAGAAHVDALCLARVAPEADGPIFSPLGEG